MAEYSQTYWNELIDQYRNGTISDQNRFQLEKQALDDPFLFDALEGFSLYDDEAKEENKNKTLTKIFTLPRIAAAASIVLLVAFMFNLKMNSGSQIESDNTIAMVLEEDEKAEISEERKSTSINSMVSSASETETSSEPEQILTDRDNKTDNFGKAVANETKMDRPATVIAPSNSKPAKDIVEANKEKVEEVPAVDMDIVALDEADDEIEKLSINQDKEEVVDVSNEVSVESEAKSQEPQLMVPVASGSNVKREEVSRMKKAQIKTYFEAVPVIGKEIFDDYAKERIDKRGLRQEKPQEVTIEFTIDKNGNLTDFHHIFTGCPECGPFAIAILTNSGEWKTVPPGYAGKARYTFVF